MNDVTTQQVVNSNSEIQTEIENWVQPSVPKPEILTRQDLEDRRRRREYDNNVANLSPEDELKRRTDFEDNFRKMQSDYRDTNSSSQPVIIRTVSRWKFWRFWT